MNRCVFLIEDWVLNPKNKGGATSLSLSHLPLALACFERVHLVILVHDHRDYPYSKKQLADDFSIINDCSKVSIFHIPEPVFASKFVRLFQWFLNPTAYRYGCWSQSQLNHFEDQFSLDENQNVIWVEHLFPATFASIVFPDRLIVYSHHDWNWKIKELRSPSSAMKVKKSISHLASRWHEERLVKRVTACVSGSESEVNNIRNLGARNVEYFPTTYQAVDLPKSSQDTGAPRIVHLGSMLATANRVGLERFLQVCWPVIIAKIEPAPELWVVGTLDGSSKQLLELLEVYKVRATGFVEDLSQVLRPYDIHVVPWEYDTGTRTRIPLILNYSQALISTKAAAACITELEHNRNCLLVDDLESMTDCIIALFSNRELRVKISNEGRKTFISSFTRESQQARFMKFIRKLMV